MTKPTKTLPPAEDPDELLELSGDFTDYWSYSQIRDYVLLMRGLPHTALRLYLVLRSMIKESNARRHGGLRRMTIDQLCWLLPGTGPDDKPISVSAMYGLLNDLEKADLVHQKDAREVEGASKLKGKEKAACGIARGLEVKDLPPAKYEGWRNSWDKLDAYHPDWRKNPPKPPTHITEVAQDEGGRITTRVRPTRPGGAAFQKTGTAQVEAPDAPSFQKTGTAFQDSGKPAQNPGTDLALTSANDHPLRSSLEEALSSQGDPSETPSAPAPAGTKRRGESSATPEDNSAAAGGEAKSAAVVAAWTEGMRAGGRQFMPKRAAAIAAEATELLAAGHSVEHLSRVAEWMGRVKPTWKVLEDAMTWPEAPQATLPKQRSGPAMCERHPTFVEGDCPSCRIAERERAQRGKSEPAAVNGAELLARLRAGQSV